MYTKSQLLLFALISLLILGHCKIKTTADKDTQVPVISTISITKTDSLTGFDKIIQQLKTERELIREDIIALNIDTFYSHNSGETSYCESTVQLNDSIFYSIIALPDQAGVCSHTFIVTINEKKRQAITSRYLEPDCDVDYSWDSYDLYEHKKISKDTLQLIKTAIFQKKNRVFSNEDENIDHKKIQKYWFIILPTGEIRSPNNIDLFGEIRHKISMIVS